MARDPIKRLHDWLAAQQPEALELDDRSPALSEETRGRLSGVLAALARNIATEMPSVSACPGAA